MAALQYPTTIYGTGHSLSFTPNADNQLANTGYAYDGDGNPTTYDSASFSFDPEDRLVGIVSPSFSAGYAGDGSRTYVTASGTTTYFVYDASGFPLVEEDDTGTVQFSDLVGADGVRGRTLPADDTVFYGFAYDPEGNIVSTAENNDIYDTRQDSLIDPYGAVLGNYLDSTGSSNPFFNPFIFGGQWGYYYDFSTGLYLLGSRYYDAATGRFLNRDTIGYQGGENLYNAFGGNPVNEQDPGGTWTLNPFNPNFYTRSNWHDIVWGRVKLNQPSLPDAADNSAGLHAVQVPYAVNPLGLNPAAASAGFRKAAVGVAVGIVGSAAISAATDGIGRIAGGGAIAGAAEGSGGGLEIGLGTSEDGLPALKKVAPQALDFKQLGLAARDPEFGDKILRFMQSASKIHFSVDGMTNVNEILSADFLWPKGTTNWELRTIWNDPGLMAKTTFYMGGRAISAADVTNLP
jgi:RHS repeat-associated protein